MITRNTQILSIDSKKYANINKKSKEVCKLSKRLKNNCSENRKKQAIFLKNYKKYSNSVKDGEHTNFVKNVIPLKDREKHADFAKGSREKKCVFCIGSLIL